MKKNFLTCCIIMLSVLALDAQVLTGASARFSDSFVEWDIFDDSLDQAGNLTMTWQRPDDWSQWSYRLGEKTGTIKTKWTGDFSQWEVRGGNKVVTASMIWQNDPRNWRITDNSITLDLKCTWSNSFQEWRIDDAKYGSFTIALENAYDPRDWLIEDELDDAVSLAMKMAVVFIAIFNSVPKN